MQVADAIVYPAIFTEPYQQACFNFLKREFRKKSVVKWFSGWLVSKWLWLHCREDDDTTFCYTCIKAFKWLSIYMSVRNAKNAFISRGFSNWKLAQNGPECNFRWTKIQILLGSLATCCLWQLAIRYLNMKLKYWSGHLKLASSTSVDAFF